MQTTFHRLNNLLDVDYYCLSSHKALAEMQINLLSPINPSFSAFLYGIVLMNNMLGDKPMSLNWFYLPLLLTDFKFIYGPILFTPSDYISINHPQWKYNIACFRIFPLWGNKVSDHRSAQARDCFQCPLIASFQHRFCFRPVNGKFPHVIPFNFPLFSQNE